MPDRERALSLERRLRTAGLLIVLGLLVQLIASMWTHPLAFVAYIVIACPLVAAGIVLYLYALISPVGTLPPG